MFFFSEERMGGKQKRGYPSEWEMPFLSNDGPKRKNLNCVPFFWDHVEWKIDLVGGLRSIVNATNESRRSTEQKSPMTLKQVSERFAGTPRHLSAVCFLVMAAALVRPGQPWHVGERQLQLQQKTVASSDEMGPHIYHKVGFGWVGFGNLVDGDLRSCVACISIHMYISIIRIIYIHILYIALF